MIARWNCGDGRTNKKYIWKTRRCYAYNEGTAEGISSTVKVTMTFSDSAVTDVVVDTSGETASYGAAAADQLREQLMAAGSAEIDGVSGSTITSDAVMKSVISSENMGISICKRWWR